MFWSLTAAERVYGVLAPGGRSNPSIPAGASSKKASCAPPAPCRSRRSSACSREVNNLKPRAGIEPERALDADERAQDCDRAFSRPGSQRGQQQPAQAHEHDRDR